MEQRRTDIFLSSPDGDTIINDFRDARCLRCISENSKLGQKKIDCPIYSVSKRICLKNTDSGNLYVCDNKEKSSKNFDNMVELLYHSSKSLASKYVLLKAQARESARNEIDTFKHNIEHINSDAINEFYSFIPQDIFVKNFRKLQDSVRQALFNDKDGAVNLIVRLARYNLNIKTELSIISKLDSAGSSPNFSKANPRDSIMTNVYMLYPDFKSRDIYVNVSEYRERFDIDFEALQVATYYIIENASKYAHDNSILNIEFENNKTTLTISFSMYSLFIGQEEEKLIFDEGFKGAEAIETGRSGKGIGLFRAKRLISFCKGELFLNPGNENSPEEDGLHYANNTFIIELPFNPNY